MADQDFNIKVVTTADTSGIKQTSAEFEKLKQQAEKARQDAGAAALFARVPPGGSAQSQGTPGDPVNTNLTRGFISAAGFGYIVARVINGIAEETNKVTAELDKQGEHLVDLSQKWTDMAKAATSSEDIAKIAASGAKEIDELGKAIIKAANPDVSIGATIVDNLVKRFMNLGKETEDAMGPNEELAQALLQGLAQDQQAMIELNAHAIELGRTFEDSFAKRQAEPLADALADVAKEMDKAKTEQDALTGAMLRTKGGIDRYNELSSTLANLTRQTDLLTAADVRRQRQAEAADKARAKAAAAEDSFIKGAVGTADPNVQRVLQNEEAARRAQAEGRGNEADAFTKTAEAFKRGLGPSQLEELAGLESAIQKMDGTLTQILNQFR